MAVSADPFVGRDGELAFLRRRLADALAGSGGLVMVSGAAGIGKTRLVEALVDTAEEVRVGWGAAVDNAGMPALWPWTRAVRALPAACAAVASLAAGGAQREYGSAADAAAATFAADTAVVDALEQQARAGPGLLVVLDDLQWADQATLRLLERVTAELRRLPVLVLGTSRDGTGRALPPGLARGTTETLHLGPLTATEAATLLSAAVERADPAAVRHAVRLAGGSPLYLRTLARVAADRLRGRVSWDDAVGQAPELRHLVVAAMRGAGPEAAGAVEALSVLGPEAAPELLARLLDLDSAASAVERLLPAVPAGLVEVQPAAGGQVRFAHALVRDAVYASLAPSRRIGLHRRAAELLEPLAVARDDRAGAVTRHWDRAGEPGRALRWAVRAADAARAAGAHDEAASYLRLALGALDRGVGAVDGEVDRAELLLDLARVEYLAGRIGDSVATSQQAADEGQRTGRAEIVGRAAIVVQGIGHPAVNVAVEGMCRRALAMAGHGLAPELLARIQAQLACALIELEAVDEAGPWTRAALAAAEASGNPNAELDAIRARVMLEWRPGADDEVWELGRRAVALAQPTGRPLAELWARVWRHDSAVRRADMTAAQSEIAAMQALADRTGLPLVRWHVLRRLASLAVLTGSFDSYRRLARQAAEIAESWQDESARNTHFGQTVCLALLRGDPSDLAPGWTDDLDRVAGWPPVAHAGFAAALLLVGRRDEARALYEPVVPALLGAQSAYAAASVAYLVELAPAFGDVPACLAIRDWIDAAFGQSPAVGFGTVFYQGSVARMMGQLEVAAGEPAEAIAHFEEGLRVDAKLGARPHVARGRMGLAQALSATGDRPRAVELARAAAAEARRLDMPGLLRTADAFLTEAAATARAEDPLTAREHEIVELVAEALSNRDIARRLVLSERTVESHVRRILAKTGFNTRTELTRWYLQQQATGRRG